MNKKVRVAIYVRVSTQEQAKEGYSISEQTDRLTSYARINDYAIVKVYTDAGFSGGNMNRPALSEMISDITAGRIDKVCVYKLDRLSRSQKDTMTLLEDIFLKNHVDFESMTERFDTSTSFGHAMIGILSIFAQLERENIKERMSLGMYARLKQGKWKGGARTPFGYDYDQPNDVLVVNDYESMIVKYIFEAVASGKTLFTVSETLRKNGYAFHNGKVDRKTMRYILRSKTYLGYIKCKDEWIKGLHPAIIDKETYDKVQAILDANQRRFESSGYKTGTSAISTNLGGFIYCAHCGSKYSKYKTGDAKSGWHYNYACYSRHKKVKTMIKDPNCKNKIYRIDDLDGIIFDEIRKLAIDTSYIDAIRQDHRQDETGRQISAIRQQIGSINSQISRLLDLYSTGRYSIDDLDSKTLPLTDQRNRLQATLESLQESTDTMTDAEVIDLVESFSDALDHGTLQERRTIIEQLINKIVIDNDEITIHWNFA